MDRVKAQALKATRKTRGRARALCFGAKGQVGNLKVNVCGHEKEPEMKKVGVKRELLGRMPHFTVRLPRDTAEALLSESAVMGRSVSETLRLVANRYAARQAEDSALLEKLSQLHLTLCELGRDFETITRLFLVATKIASEEDAKDWCKQNLRVGK